MNNFIIRRPRVEDVNELKALFRMVITDTFHKEGIGHLLEDMEEEIETKNNYLSRDIESGGKDRYFLIALDGDQIVGTIEFGPASELINQCTNHAWKGMYEVGTVFVHPNYQKRGIGNQLLESLKVALKNRGIKEFCLDSGYKNAQKIWQRKFGEPDYLLKEYWGEGAHHMIWRIKVPEV